MSIIKAIEKAYKKAEERGYDRIYYAIDVHDTILKSNYENGGYEFVNEDAKKCLRMFARHEEIRVILWSSLTENEKENVAIFLYDNGCYVDDINENTLELDTEYADFSQKFYFSVLLDDKAGFDPGTDWKAIMEWYEDK